MHDNQGDSVDMNAKRYDMSYEVDPHAVAEALIRRVNALADERAQARRALIRSVEVLVPSDLDDTTIAS
jgi:hypothetical protein